MTSEGGVVPMEAILNVRDIGKYINSISGEQTLRSGSFYRGARPDEATPSDRHRLTQALGIKTIIDLRTPTEHLEARKKHADHVVSSVPGVAPGEPQQPLRMPDINYEDINFNGDAYTNALLAQLSWTQTARLYALYAIGYRKEAISILAANVMAPRGLSGLAIDSLVHCKAEVKAVFSVLASESNFPVLVHCTQGKDRTGLVVLLVLLLCGVSEEAIERDYMQSQEGLAPEREAKVEEVKSIGLPEHFADCEIDWVRKVTHYIQAEWGGVDLYLEDCGVAQEYRQEVRQAMLLS